MSYELCQDETLGVNLRRIMRKQIELAIEITKNNRETEDTPVHETRKHLKKARAALRLVAKEIGRAAFCEVDRPLRDVGRSIAQIRDAEARLETVRQVQSRNGGKRFRHLENVLALEMESFVAAFTEWQVEATPQLEKACAAVDDWALDNFKSAALARAVQKTYKNARQKLAKASDSASAENFHEFRSAAKVLDYQMRILRPTNPVVIRNLINELDCVASVLGRAHDLNFLGARLGSERGKAQWQREGQQLLDLIETGQGDLQRCAAELGERFFAERPRDFGQRVMTWIDDWLHERSASLAEKLVH